MKKIIRGIGECCSWLLLAALVLAIGALLFTRLGGAEPTFFGYRLFVISTGSMEPAYAVGDVILSRNFTPGDALREGDVLTYRGSGETEGMYVTHRLLAVAGNGDRRTLTLQGDANNVPDAPCEESRVVAVTVCRLPLTGKLFGLMRSRFGMPVLLLLILGFIVKESLSFRKALAEKRAADAQNEPTTEKNEN